MPRRYQRSRRVKLPEGVICVTRPGPFGNPFNWKDAPEDLYTEGQAKAMVVIFFKEWLDGKRGAPNGEKAADLIERLPILRGRDLACWCKLPKPGEDDCCHASVLIDYANRE